MKKHIYFTLLFLATIACKGQSPVYNIDEPSFGKTPGSYFKDLNGVLDGYDGTYLYNDFSSNTSLKIVLKKKVLSYGYYYEDLIVGEFQFIRNGYEVTNTLANININYTDEEVNHAITGSRILTGTIYGCPDCSPTEKRLRLSLIDGKSNNIVGLDIRKTTVNGVPAIKVLLFGEESGFVRNADGSLSTSSYMLELGEYIMIKQ
jgi:hypothetical protein